VRSGLPPISKGPLVIDPGGFQLGIIPPNSVYETVATLRNRGSVPVRITATQSSCICTVPEGLEGAVIPPGGSHPFTMTYTGRTAPGPKTAKVILEFEQGGLKSHVLIQIEADIAMAVRAEPAFANALKGVTSGQLRIDSLDGRPFRILSAYGEAPVYVDGFDPGRDEPRTAYTLLWKVEYPTEADCANARYWWVVETDHPDCPVLPVEIRHDCTGARRLGKVREQRWFFPEYLVNLGQLKGGETVEADIELQKIRGRTTLRIDSVESLTPDATAELVEVIDSPDTEFMVCIVRFTPRRGHEGVLYADVVFRTEAGDQDFPFISRVVPK
jgi:hypothetical protein